MNSLTDEKLIELLKGRVKIERKVCMEIIEYLKEVQKRRLFSDYGYNSLHAFCVGFLGYSDGETSRKIRTIKLVDVLPEAKEMIEKGTLNITNASSLFTHFMGETRPSTAIEKLKLLKEIENRPTRKVERILAENTGAGVVKPKETKKAIKGKRISVKFSLEENEYEKLQVLMREFGINSMEELVIKMRGVVEKKKEVKDRKSRLSSKSGYVSAKVRREVLKRDNHRCVICGNNNFLELDHILPVGKNGTSTVNNLRTCCKNCNTRFAIKEYGQLKMDQFLNQNKDKTPTRVGNDLMPNTAI